MNMELGLSLGETPKSPFLDFMKNPNNNHDHHQLVTSKNPLAFFMALSIATPPPPPPPTHKRQEQEEVNERKQNQHGRDADDDQQIEIDKTNEEAHQHILQLDLLPNTPVPRNFLFSSSVVNGGNFDGKRRRNTPFFEEEISNRVHEDGGAVSSSPNNSASASSFQMGFCLYGNKMGERGCSSRGVSDEDENGNPKKKLRLSKEQSVFLEDSFKEHNTLNPKQKLALSKQLNLRPRQVEVWFQNRRARTKLKQTEVDCDYLKRCCDTLTEENKRLQKELQELRALKTSNPFYMQSPATTLTMCPSCEKVATTSAATTVVAPDNESILPATNLSLDRQPVTNFNPFSHTN